METIGYLINDSIDSENTKQEIFTQKVVEFLTPRFFTVTTHFERILTIDNEKSLKLDVALSICEIMRLMGSENVTQFRYEILAVLRTVLASNRMDLQDECAKAWEVFIRLVDTAELGPMLSTIIISLQQIMNTHYEAVDKIFRYLIIENGNLMQTYLGDLFFLLNTNVSEGIKVHVASHIDQTIQAFEEKMIESLKRINHENVMIRIHGLDQLTHLLRNNRRPMNDLTISQNKIHIEQLINTLMMCIKSHDEGIRVAAGRCIGELAAIEPSHLSTNCRTQASFAHGINTDEFAVIALTELFSAYESQTGNLDAYAVAIQKILIFRKVSSVENENSKIWQAIPSQMKSLVVQLLTSRYYTIAEPLTEVKVNPVFGNIFTTFHEWAFTWACKMINAIGDESIQNVLRSFKMSMNVNNGILTMSLPYIILHTIKSCSEDDRKEIADEFNTIIEFIVSDHGTEHDESVLNITNDESSPQTRKCGKVLLSLLNFLDHWVRMSPTDIHYGVVNTFLNQFNHESLITVAIACEETDYALMYLEAFIEKHPQRIKSVFHKYFFIYAELMDQDSIEGLLKKTGVPLNTRQKVVWNMIRGRLQDSAIYYEHFLHQDPLNPICCSDAIKYHVDMGQTETANLLAHSLIEKLHDEHRELIEKQMVEPLWRLGHWDELGKLFEKPHLYENLEWGIQCGRLLLDFRKNDINFFESEIAESRLTVLEDLRFVDDAQNCYHSNYSNVMKLHLISEIEQAHSIKSNILNGHLSVSQITNAVEELFNNWNGRLQLLQPEIRVIEPVLCLRRVLLNGLKDLVANHLEENILNVLKKQLNNYIEKLFIKSIELARDDDRIQQAELYALNAESELGCSSKLLSIERAKILWKKGDQPGCFEVLKSVAENVLCIDSSQAEAKFLIAHYRAKSLTSDSNLNHLLKGLDLSAREVNTSKAWLTLAKFHDTHFNVDPIIGPIKNLNKELAMNQAVLLRAYFESMTFDSEYFHESLPRALNIWLDFTTTSEKYKGEKLLQSVAKNMNEIVQIYIPKLPAFVVFTAFSQLISRICHQSNDVFKLLTNILVDLIQKFPQQSLWMILHASLTENAIFSMRTNEVLADNRLNHMRTLIEHFKLLARRLIALMDLKLSGRNNFSIDKEYPALQQTLSDPNFSPILIPVKKFLHPYLPALYQCNESIDSFNPFPNTAVFIKAVKDKVIVMQSQQMPLCVSLLGSDGDVHTIMLKKGDDLRKDMKVMELYSVVNHHLNTNCEARQRHLNIRRYAAIPLNENHGIIEFVPNLKGLSVIIDDTRSNKKMKDATKAELDRVTTIQKTKNSEECVKYFNSLCNKYQPVLAYWFFDRFPTPISWLKARKTFTRTTAVMSFVGYILGLGDRHGENVLIDVNNGEVVHVDYDCLFNKAEEATVPEAVPFRLTQNMVRI